MSSYNQRKKKEALRRLSQGRVRGRIPGDHDSAARRPFHQRAHTVNDALLRRQRSSENIHRKVPAQTSVSPLEKAEVQGRSSSSPLFGKPASSTTSGLFGRASSTSENQFSSKLPTPEVAGLFGKGLPSSMEAAQEGSSASLPHGDVLPAASKSEGSLFGKQQHSKQDLVFGVIKPSSTELDSSTQTKTLFGKQIPHPESSSTIGPTAEAPVGLFGKTKEPASVSQPDKTLFGKQIGHPESTSRATEGVSKEAPKGLFGKALKATSDQRETPAGLFGKPPKDASDQQSVTSTKTLFGKPIKVEMDQEADSKPAGLFGKGNQEADIKPTGLFGKGKPVPFQRSFVGAKQSVGGSKRTLIQMEDDQGRGQDLSDLESFGASRRQREADSESDKKPAVRRRGLFGKAVEDIEGKKKRRSDEGDSEGRKQKRLPVMEHHRTASQEEIKQITSIVCKDIPRDLNLRGLLVDIFQEYGEVVKVSCQPENNAAIIYFADHSSAYCAKKKVKELRRGAPVSIYWARTQSKSSKSDRAKSKSSSATSSPVRSETVRDRTSTSPSRRSHPAQERISVSPSRRSFPAQERVSVSPSRRPFPVRAREDAPAVSSSHGKISSKAIKASLKALEGRIGNTASERLEILEERDQLKRQERAIDHGSMPTLLAECEDMCPEKERYMREFQRRLSIYEVQNVGARELRVCHPTAVKEYSRSSADQELPLPSDLRSPGVLTMTMNYLMNNIMDKGLGEEGHSWGEWYNFLWDRTRSIRKDITQQQLCDTTAVDLLEKCTRFHIFCAHRLCEADSMTFDPKINTENLTKCLQSLKHLYDDLAEKGVTCPNESEFRAYDVLLNLNQGDILRQVQNYRSEVRNSLVIRFAVQCVSAISSQNYVRFFKLVKSSTYLNGCIMHRYFTQVRNTAIEIITRSFSTGRGSGYPISEVTRLLAFENQEQATVFCEAHGLSVSDGTVLLSWNDFVHPNYAIVPSRSVSIIEDKNTSLIGEIVNGGKLPLNLRHHPASSFDRKGRFSLTKFKVSSAGIPESREEQPLLDDVLDDAEPEAVPQLPEPNQTRISPPPPEHTSPEPSIVTIKEVAKDIFFEVIDEAAKEVYEGFLGNLHWLMSVTDTVATSLLEETTTTMVQQIAEEVLGDAIEDARRTEYERQERERRIAETQRTLQELAGTILQDTVEEVLHTELRDLTTTEIRIFEREQHDKCLERVSTALSVDYMDVAVSSLCHQISAEVYEEEIRLRDEALAKIERNVQQLQQGRYFHIWKQAFAKRLRLKDTIETFPAGPSTNDVGDQLREFIPEPRKTSLGDDVTSFVRVYEQQHNVAKSILRRHHQDYLSSKELWSPYDIPSLTGDLLSEAQGTADHLFWKLIVSLPSSSKSEEFTLFCSWLKSKLRRGYIPEQLRRVSPAEEVEIETCSLYSTKIDARGTVGSVCTKVISGTLPTTETDGSLSRQVRDALIGSQGVIFIQAPYSNYGNQQSYWREQSKRLLRLLTNKPKIPGLPLLIYSVDEDASPGWIDVCQRSLNVASLQAEGYVTEVTYSNFTGNLWEANLAKKVGDDLKWLAASCPTPPQLESVSLCEFVDNGLTNYFSLQIRENETFRRRAKMPEECFDTVISLYNAVIQHLIVCCTGVRLRQLNWPPTEFSSRDDNDLPAVTWNDPSTMADLQRLLSSMVLPKMGDVIADSWEDMREHCLLYVKSLMGSPHEKLPLISRVTWLLERCQREFEGVCRESYQTGGCSLHPETLPWTSLAETCVEYVVGLLKERQHHNDDDMKPDRMVYFFQEDFDKFRTPQEWLDRTMDTLEESVLCPESIDRSYLTSVEERQLQIEREVEGEMVPPEEKSGSQWTTTLTDLPRESVIQTEVNITADRLDKLLATEKEESDRYEEYLQSLLEDTPLPLPIEPAGSFVQAGDADTLLADKIKKLEAELSLSRRANRTMELRLETIINL